MPTFLLRGVLGFFCVALVASLAPAAEPAAAVSGPTVAVQKTYDGRPFEYRIQSQTPRDGYILYRLTYPSPVVTSTPQNNTVPAELYMPAGIRPGDPKRPAVICMHILDGNMELVQMVCTVLAGRGIPAILFKLPYYGERGVAGGPEAMARNPRLFMSAIDQAMEDVRRTVDVLASRPEIDPAKIGITGISLGGIVACSAAERDPRLGRTMLILAGGDLPRIIHHARETRELSALILGLPPDERLVVDRLLAEVDPLRHADQLRDRARAGKVRMVNAAIDEVIPPVCSQRLGEALGMADRVQWLEGLGHYTAMSALPQILQDMVVFFGEDLPPGTQAPPVPSRTPAQMVLGIAQDAVNLLSNEPAEGRCHFVDLELSLSQGDKAPLGGTLRFIRGRAGQFKLEVKAPAVGDVALGQGRFPWMASGNKAVFAGTRGQPLRDPLALVDSRHIMKLRMASGLIGGAVLAPDMIEPVATLTAQTDGENNPVVVVRPKKAQGEVVVRFASDRKTPRAIDFDVDGVRGKLTFRVWQLNTVAHGELFEPPPGVPVTEVDAADVYRIFAAAMNFAMENLE